MDDAQYLAQRVEEQIAWYDRKSQSNQNAFKRLRLVEITAAGLIPLLAGYAGEVAWLHVGIGVLGLIVAVIAGVVSVYRFQENWTEYRSACEVLRQEKFLFLTRTQPYDVSEPFPLLVQRVESLLSKEHADWAQQMRAGTKGKPHG